MAPDVDYAVIEVDGDRRGQRARRSASGCCSPRGWSRASPPRPGSRRSSDAGRAATARRSPAPSAAIRCTARATTSTCRCWPATSSTTEDGTGPRPHRPRPRRRRLRARARRTASRCRTRSPRTASTPTRCRCSPACTCSRRPSPVIAAPARGGRARSPAASSTHSYPHSWRSKAPLIFRATPQWFIPMEGTGRLRAKALAAIEADPLGPGRRARTASAA